MESEIHTYVLGYVAIRLAALAGFAYVAYKILNRWEPAVARVRATHQRQSGPDDRR